MRARLKSYLKITDPKIESLNEEADHLEYVVLRSDIEALIEESKLIKELKPKYNVIFRDDKSYSYVYFTKESFPKIFVGHARPAGILKNKKFSAKIGPFTDNGALRVVMKLLRRYFPYCTCSQNHLRDCLNAQIGKCVGICCKKNQIGGNAEYKKMLRKIKMILTGQSRKLAGTLTDPKEREALEKIFEHRPYIQMEASAPEKHPGGGLDDIYKVECYDNSNFAGKEAVGAMTALVKINGGWQPDKNSYRKFKIKATPTRDDPRMMGELIRRRLNHPEWPYPDLIIIDGGLTQFNAARAAAGELTSKIKIISFAKPQKLVYGLRPGLIPVPLAALPKELRELIERAIYQTHRFAIRFHREIRSKAFISR